MSIFAPGRARGNCFPDIRSRRRSQEDDRDLKTKIPRSRRGGGPLSYDPPPPGSRREGVRGSQRQAQHRRHRRGRAGRGGHRRHSRRKHRGPLRRGLGPGGQEFRVFPRRQTLSRFPRYAGKAEGHRRRGRGDPRPRPCRGDHGGFGAGQACLLRKAPDLQRLRGPDSHKSRPGGQGRDPDGKPGSCHGEHPPAVRMDLGRGHRQRHRGPGLDAPPGLAAGHAPPPCRDSSRTRHPQLGSVAGPRARPAVSSLLSAAVVARLAGFRDRRARRYGLPYLRPYRVVVEARRAGERRGHRLRLRPGHDDLGQAREHGDLSAGVHRHLQVPGPRGLSAPNIDLV